MIIVVDNGNDNSSDGDDDNDYDNEDGVELIVVMVLHIMAFIG